ncbi:MAG: VacB/RNase II family 3'-5' exoribonuclease, partial [Elusimicrobiota bacterium]|jgi:ribonuclease R
LPEEFPEAVLAESRAFPDEVSADMGAGRLDLRGLPIFTIDGADAKDFDDAVSLEVIDSLRVRLGVHIADVAHYVRRGTALDAEAAERATSIYLADRVVPMLPPNLSNGLCSLMPSVDRLALSCFMDLDANGNVRFSSLKQSVIRSRRRFTYEEVEAAMQGERVLDVDAQVHESILRMRALAKTLTVRRLRKGALDLNSAEFKVVVDAEGRPQAVVKRPRLASHRLIEEFMLLANETVARTLLARKLPFLSRIHPAPETRKLAVLSAELNKLGVYAPVSLTKTPSTALQIVLQKAVGQPLEDTINMLVMRSLQQASYSNTPGAHFGLASPAYCHFTSPIRRYPDLVTHRAVKAFIQDRPDPSLAQGLKEIAEHCSARERVAAEAERRSVDMLRAQLLQAQVGQVFEGVVSGTAGFGIFVTLLGVGASGLLRGGSAALGSRVRVKLDRVDEGKGELDLSLAGIVRPAEPAPAGLRPGAHKPRYERRDQPKYDANKPRPGHRDKPKYDPDKPRFHKGFKPKFDPSKPRYERGAKPKYDPDKPRFHKGPKPKYDPNKSKHEPAEKSKHNPYQPHPHQRSKPKSGPHKPGADKKAVPKFYEALMKKRRRRGA